VPFDEFVIRLPRPCGLPVVAEARLLPGAPVTEGEMVRLVASPEHIAGTRWRTWSCSRHGNAGCPCCPPRSSALAPGTGSRTGSSAWAPEGRARRRTT